MTQNPSSNCPTAAVLETYLTGRLPDAEHESVAAHVDRCDNCQRSVESLHPDEDSIVGDLRRNVGDAFEQETECNGVVDRVKGIGSGGLLEKASVSPPQSSANIKRLGPYVIDELLGKGAMGEVYRATHTKLKRPVAIKVLRGDAVPTPRAVARFEREMEAIGQLDHPNIVRANDADVQDGVHYLVMEYVDGNDLAQVVLQHGSLTVADACEIVRQSADGLQYASDRGIVHRDIKPSNLILCESKNQGGQPTVKILDMGLALLRDQTDNECLTADSHVLGTPDYLAPEQWESTHAVDTRADIYSLGCTLVCLLRGRPPFSGSQYGSLIAKMRAHLDDQPPDSRTLQPDIPLDLANLIDKSLSKSPDNRYAQPAELAAALEPFCAGADLSKLLLPANWQTMAETVVEPVDGLGTLREKSSAARTKTIANLSNLMERGRFLTVLGVVALLMLLASAAVVIWKPDSKERATVVAGEPTTVTRFDAIHFRYDVDQQIVRPLGLIQQQLAAVMLQDEIQIEVELGRPAWSYLLACNPDGQLQLCYPPNDAAPEQRATFVFPTQRDAYFSLTDGEGQQAFVLVVSDKPLPPWLQWCDRISDLSWSRVEQDGVWVFEHQGVRQVFSTDDTPRGEVVVHTAVEFGQLCSLLKSQPDIVAVQAIAFPVREAR